MSDDAPKKAELIVMTKVDKDGTVKRVRTKQQPSDFTRLHHGVLLDALPYTEQLRAVGMDQGADDALDYIDDYLAEVQPRNPVERMLAVQMLWLHKRLGQLATQTAKITRADHLRGLYAASDAGLASFRKHALAFQQLREPRPVQFIKAGQANFADKQVVNNTIPPASGPESVPSSKVENEVGLEDAPYSPPPLPPVIPGSDVLAGLRAPREAVGEIHRASDAVGQGTLRP
ncbi:MAG: hypothetical protein IT436_18940 [Phycisphaerales bacterium]|nr:hypothetical protein [Phycisphaerales bacterium]